MKKVTLILALCVAMVALSGAAFADTLVYSTTGVFNCNGNTTCSPSGNVTTLTIGNSTNNFTISFAGIPPTGTSPIPGNPSMGTFTVKQKGSGSTVTTTGGTPTFTLTVTQVLPTPNGNQSVSANLHGQITTNSVTGELLFTIDPTNFSIGDVNYQLALGVCGITASCGTGVPNFTLVKILNGPTVNNGDTTLEAQVTENVPEPASMVLLGSGLLGAGGFIRRKIRR